MLDGFRTRVAEWRRHRRFGGIGDLSAGNEMAGAGELNASLNPETRVARHGPRKIINRRLDAMFTVFSSCSICRIFPGSTTLLRRRRKERLRHPAAQAVSGRENVVRAFLAAAAAGILAARAGRKIFSEIAAKSFRIPGCSIPRRCRNTPLFHDWRFTIGAKLAKFSQKDRDLLLKVSGFSPLGWGSRGVASGADLPHAEWESRIENALAKFENQPTILQRFHKGSLFEHRYWDESGELKSMKGRVRLCPYYLWSAIV